MRFTAFLDGELLGEWINWDDFIQHYRKLPWDVYLFDSVREYHRVSRTGWFRRDLSPVLEDDVPAILKHLQLVLSL